MWRSSQAPEGRLQNACETKKWYFHHGRRRKNAILRAIPFDIRTFWLPPLERRRKVSHSCAIAALIPQGAAPYLFYLCLVLCVASYLFLQPSLCFSAGSFRLFFSFLSKKKRGRSGLLLLTPLTTTSASPPAPTECSPNSRLHIAAKVCWTFDDCRCCLP